MRDYRGKVLVIDDTEANRYVLVRLLEKAGHTVIQAADGRAGLALLGEHPDVVIIDVNLPDIKGTDLAHGIKSDPETASIMVLNMSASYTRTQDRIVALDHGADGYLTQPIDPQEFLATVASLLRIRQAEEAMRRSNRELENFAYVASHDLQEPLRMVTSYLDLLERRHGAALDDSAREYIHYAVDGAKRMGGMVRDLLALSQVECSTIEKKPTESRALLQGALDNLAVKIKESSAAIVIADLPTITVDGGLITQVFQNLLVNAIKFRSDRPLEVRISAERDREFQVFSVQDNGIGIAQEDTDKIFGIFQRLHSNARYPGSGIGLSLCKRVVERHKGAIGVRSQLGAGTCFWFSVPA